VPGIGSAVNIIVLMGRPLARYDQKPGPFNPRALNLQSRPFVKRDQTTSQARVQLPTLREPTCITTHTAR